MHLFCVQLFELRWPQGYFRDVTKEDLAEMLPSFANPLEDPIFLISPIGRPYSLSDEDEPVMRSSAGHPRSIARAPHQQPLLKDRVSELKAQAAAEVRAKCMQDITSSEEFAQVAGGCLSYCNAGEFNSILCSAES